MFSIEMVSIEMVSIEMVSILIPPPPPRQDDLRRRVGDDLRIIMSDLLFFSRSGSIIHYVCGLDHHKQTMKGELYIYKGH